MSGYDPHAPQVVYAAPPIVMVSPEYHTIRDWLAWSIINIFIGWGGGFLPLIFSIICRSCKNSGDFSTARTMSIFALIFNILLTLGGLGGWVALVVVLVIAASAATVII